MPHPPMGHRKTKWNREHSARDREIYRLAVIECRLRKELAGQFDLCERRILEIISEQHASIQQEWPEYIALLKDQQSARLEFIYQEAIQGWERSKQDAVSETVTIGGEHSGETRKTTKRQTGDPAFLDAAMRALEHVRKIWGVDAAKKLDVTGNIGFLIGGDVASGPRDELEDALLKRIGAIQQNRLDREREAGGT